MVGCVVPCSDPKANVDADSWISPPHPPSSIDPPSLRSACVDVGNLTLLTRLNLDGNPNILTVPRAVVKAGTIAVLEHLNTSFRVEF